MSADDILKLLTSGGYGLTALALGAVVYLYRAREADRTELMQTIRADGEAQRAILSQTIPLAQKMTESIELIARAIDNLDRMHDRRTSP